MGLRVAIKARNVISTQINISWKIQIWRLLLLFDDRIKEDEMGESCRTNESDDKRIKILVGKLEGKRPLGRLGRRWEDNIRLNLRELDW
jgi:hypothetical protein